ncbi:hypothetical protein EVAR_52457_1 [Eumeta japonica]|uniref:Uncharacterized protein n=1 Tax=Eumeta variegata TaxID=151549 RepID=A0A4C1YZQ4_EUMVA|nr:hypothetical protein EVAR_52457_1 [Eumeta japonica]
MRGSRLVCVIFYTEPERLRSLSSQQNGEGSRAHGDFVLTFHAFVYGTEPCRHACRCRRWLPNSGKWMRVDSPPPPIGPN